jgi:hypothetical protein
MRRPEHARWFAAAAAAVAVAVTTAASTSLVGCSSGDCKEICPPVTAKVRAAMNVDVGIEYLAWHGPACPTVPPECRGDGLTTICTHTEIPGRGPGGCDLLVVFKDRLPEIVHVEFGDKKPCCTGYPVIGDHEFIIPVAADAGIYGADGGSMDAVTILWDAAITDAASDAADGGSN